MKSSLQHSKTSQSSLSRLLQSRIELLMATFSNSIAATARHLEVDRNTIRRIVAGEDVKLSLTQLSKIDDLMREHFQPLFATPRFEDWLAGQPIQFVLGVRPDSKKTTENISTFDLRAVVDMQSWLARVGGRVEWDLDFAGSTLRRQVVRILIASPRGNDASESTLCEAFELKPHSSPKKRAEMCTPFAFYWPNLDKRQTHGRSTFQIQQGLLTSAQSRSMSDAKHAGFALRNAKGGYDWHPIARNDRPTGRKSWYSYGVVVCRVTSNASQVDFCVCGATGPGTTGAARMAPALVATVSDEFQTREGVMVSWIAVRVPVSRTGPGLDERMIGTPEIIAQDIQREP